VPSFGPSLHRQACCCLVKDCLQRCSLQYLFWL
jgi:hypothetical protein